MHSLSEFCHYFYAVFCNGFSLSNGQVTYNLVSMNGQYPVGTTASFTCDSGYNVVGSNSITCQPSGTWNQQAPNCEQGRNILLFLHYFAYSK